MQLLPKDFLQAPIAWVKPVCNLKIWLIASSFQSCCHQLKMEHSSIIITWCSETTNYFSFLKFNRRSRNILTGGVKANFCNLLVFWVEDHSIQETVFMTVEYLNLTYLLTLQVNCLMPLKLNIKQFLTIRGDKLPPVPIQITLDAGYPHLLVDQLKRHSFKFFLTQRLSLTFKILQLEPFLNK